MKRQISAGAVIFRRELDGAIKFLLLYHGRNYWNFPKGQLEEGERATAAFLREVEEETGLRTSDLRIISGFRATDRFVFFAPPRATGVRHGRSERHPIFKIVIFYLVEARKREVAISREHEGFGWFTLTEATRIAKYKNTKEILKRAYEFIQRGFRGARLPRHPTHPQRPGRHVR